MRLLSSFGTIILPQFLRFVNIFGEVLQNSPPKKRTSFFEKHCICSHKYKNAAYLSPNIPYSCQTVLQRTALRRCVLKDSFYKKHRKRPKRSIFLLINLLCQHIKRCVTEATHRKTQTPIVVTQTNRNGNISAIPKLEEPAFLPRQ